MTLVKSIKIEDRFTVVTDNIENHRRPKLTIGESDRINDLCKRMSDLCKRIEWDVTT